MIKLNLAIGDGDIPELEFRTERELIDHLQIIDSYKFHCVWLLTSGYNTNDPYSEIIISQNMNTIILAFMSEMVHECNDNKVIHLHQYDTYEDAYKVALDMREGNDLCYN